MKKFNLIMKKLLFSLTIMAMAGAAFAQTTESTGFQPPVAGKWYRLVSRYNGSDPQRVGACVQYFPEGRVPAHTLFAAAPLEKGTDGYDAQFWRFEEDPDNPGCYAMINRAAPNGYLDAMPVKESGAEVTSTSELGIDCRWLYVPEADGSAATNKYGFMFIQEHNMAGVDDNGQSYAGISTRQVLDLANNNINHNVYMNAGGSRVNYAINLWSQDYDEYANEFVFTLAPEDTGGGTSDIESLTEDREADKTVYNLQGQPVSHPGRGLYVVAGHLVLL